MTIQYNTKKEKKTLADALSRKEEKGSYQAISVVGPDWVKEITASYEQTTWAKDLMTQLAIQPANQKGYTLTTGLLRYKGRLVIGEDDQIKKRILQSLHNSPIGRHSGLNVTTK